ncbi:MAG TPA: hypothetical protein VKW06_10740 [Candidatus Angelobacter sp.]|nr:hypothetical protein [Candidatus Angelobacter sp.]
MSFPGKHLRWILLLLAFACSDLAAQDTPSLADLARKTREQRQSAPAKPVLTEENIPRRQVLREFYCLPVTRLPDLPAPCHNVEIDLNVGSPPRQGGGYHWYVHYSLYLKNGHDYRVAFWPDQSTSFDPRQALENARQNYLAHVVHEEVESDFTAAAKILTAEDTFIEGGPAQLVTFQSSSNRGPRRGVALFFFPLPMQVVVVSCTFLVEDLSEATPLCDEIVRSAHVVRLPDKLKAYPTYD